MEKYLKIEVLEGYAIDRESLLLKTSYLKKQSLPIIKWNDKVKGVECHSDEENIHFIIDISIPNIYCEYDAAIKWVATQDNRELPSIHQLLWIQKHFNEINKVIPKHYNTLYRGYYWTCEEKDEFCAWFVFMNDGYSYTDNKDNRNYVRAVINL